MMQITGCKQCGKENISFNTWSVTINYNLSRRCEFCKETKTETISYFFCSKKCFEDYYINNVKFNIKPDKNVKVPKYEYLSEGCDPKICDKLNKIVIPDDIELIR